MIQSHTGCSVNDAVRIPNSESTETATVDIVVQKAG
jgi:hypothetical protein